MTAALKAWKDSKDELIQQRRALQRKMAASKSYFEWSINATKLDRLDGSDEEARWKSETKLYDRKLLEEKLSHLRAVRTANSSVTERMFAVRADLLRNLGNIASTELHQHFPLIPGPIRDYIEEVREHLEDITHSSELPLAEKSAFLKETRHAFGRTALVLSGGGALGTFHLGVVKALLEHKLLPRVLAGSSIGAVVCAFAATRTDSELSTSLEDLSSADLSFFTSSAAAASSPSAAAHWLFGGNTKEDIDGLMKRLRHLLGDFTFLEAYTHTGRVLNLSVSATGATEPPRLLNYLTTPHVLVWSAVACSSAFPGVHCPTELLARDSMGRVVKFAASESGPESCGGGNGGGSASGVSNTGWHDGSLEDDLPMRGLSEMFSVNHFIVSQTTPHIIPFLNLKRGLGIVGQLAEAEIKHRCRQALEILPRYRWPARWLRAFSQPWEGDITIALPDTVAQLAKAVVKPCRQDLLHAVHQGELSTWAKLSAIQCNCGIEATLDACIQQIAVWERAEERNRRAAMAPLKSGKLPSWADLQSLAYQHFGKSASNESLFSMSLSHAVSSAPVGWRSTGGGSTGGGSTGGGGEKSAGAFSEKLASGPTDVPVVMGVPTSPQMSFPVPVPGSTGIMLSSSKAVCSPRGIVGHARASTSTPPTSTGIYVPDSAYECTDSSVNAFPEGSISPRPSKDGALVAAAADGGMSPAATTRNSLDFIAP